MQWMLMRLDVLGCQAACFEWADSYDSKDWERLSKCIAPTLKVSSLGTLNPPPYPPTSRN
jgi:hypothetical protein